LRSIAIGDRAAHAHVVEGLLLVVDGQDGLGARAGHHHLELRVALELGHAARRDAREGVDVAGQQRGNLRGRVGDEAEGGAIELDGAALR
jgi:hypothetical protein